MNQASKFADWRQVDHPADMASDTAVPYSLLEQVVEQGGLGFSEIDPGSGKLVSANSRFCQMIGFTLDELLGGELTFRELTHPDDLERCTAKLQLLLAGEVDSCSIEKRYIQKNGAILNARATGMLLRHRGGRPSSTIGVIVAPADAESWNTIPPPLERPDHASFWSWDLRSNLGYCSSGLKTLLGLAPDAPSPSSEQLVARIHPDDRSRVVQDADRVSRGAFVTSEHRIVQPSGEIRWVSQSAKPVYDDREQVIGMLAVCLDITDERRAHSRSPAAETVGIVKRHVELNWDQPLNVDALARVANVNVRTLFKHCKQALGFTPNDYVKRVRLNHARALLELADGSTTVLGTALRCCFQNPGHFARDYRLAFGERPSETLERARKQSRH
jgi:PAS domain S-box-containing protein